MSLFGRGESERDRTIRELRDMLAVERERNERLTEKLLSLKQAGAVEAPPAQTFPPGYPLTTPAVDEAKLLIYERTGTDYRLRRMMLRQLEIDRQAKRSEEQIMAEIQAGVQTDGVPG